MELDFGTYDLHAPMPVMHLVQQRLAGPRVQDVAGEVRRQLAASGLLERVQPGQEIAVTAGSRGIHDIATVLRAVVDELKARGAQPFLVPAMGSHGGATPEGQTQLLAELGITEQSMGVPIRATMDVEHLGKLPEGPELYMDAYAAQADGIVVVNRVKPHSDFHGPIESGLAKMTVIGLGKRHGADAMHLYGAPGLRTLLPPAARFIVGRKPILAGVGIVESNTGGVARIGVLSPDQFGGEAEQALLEQARMLLPRLPFDQLDVLVVDQIGKNYSGAGMDTTVIGRVMVPGQEENPTPQITAIAVLDVSPESHGNAAGIGMADVTTRRLVEKIDFHAFYLNGITSGTFGLRRSSIPFVMQDDYTTVSLALHAAAASHPDRPRLVRIHNTLEVGTLLISGALVAEAQERGVQVLREVGPLSFADDGSIAPWPGDAPEMGAPAPGPDTFAPPPTKADVDEMRTEC
jgi:antitoxin (DNA-binding transcriptional repressor) of toxin-antitoxin stability system